MSSTIKSIAILGTGTIGASWATLYAVKGLNVSLYDESADALRSASSRCQANLARLCELQLITAAERSQAVKRLRPAKDLQDLLEGADFVHESVVETYEIKKPLFAQIDALTSPEVLVASSSSGLLISELQSVMQSPERAFIAHPFNPPHLIPLVELVSGKGTSPQTIETARAFFEGLGKVPVVLNKEVPGHIANRLAAALWREAIDLVASGVASVEDVDKALCAGPGLRWALMGQHLIYHLGGGQGGYAYFIEHIGKTFEEYWRTMADWTEIPEEAKTKVIAGADEAMRGQTLGELASWRDENLAELLKILYPQG